MKRKLENIIIDSLVKTDLWKNKIEVDCKKQNVFLAIRNESTNFYHKGGSLFKFDKNGFQTHIKYAAVIPKSGKDYLTEKELLGLSFVSNFVNDYERIKENCANYSGLEASGVSSLYHKYSYLPDNPDNPIVVLDIEVSFKSSSVGKTSDRIDLLLYNKDTKKLLFVEAKHYTNSEIISSTTPKVISQIENYNKQLTTKRSVILNEYKTYINLINSIFGKSLPLPVDIESEVMLLIFGFDNDQKKGRLKDIESLLKCINFYSIGNINNLKLSTLFK